MEKFKTIFGLLAIVVASVFAYSFTVKHSAAISDDKKQTTYWIKYNCKENPGVTFVTGGPNFTVSSNPADLPGYSPNCPGQLSLCAKLFAAADVIDDPSHPGNKIPAPGRENSQIDVKKCLSIVP